MSYEEIPSAQVQLDGTPLPGGTRRPLPDGGLLTIAGVGSIRIDAARVSDANALQEAEAALAAALRKAGAGTVAEAREAAAARERAAAQLPDQQELMRAYAPQGLDALEQELAALPEAAAEPEAELPSRAEGRDPL